MRFLVRVLPALAGLTLLALLAVLAVAWWNSRLPGTYDPMAYAVADYGGGAQLSHHGHVRVDQLTGPQDAIPAVETTLTAQKDDDRWTFNGRVPGPEIRVQQGGVVRVTLVNRDIDQGVTIHWHGVDVPNAEDGVAGVTQDAVMPGERYMYTFRAEQLGTFWYHSHQVSSSQVRHGLYGAFVIVPRRKATGLDRTLIVHDFDNRAAINDDFGLQRERVAPGTPVRLRLVNSNSSLERVTVTGTPYSVVGIDGTDVTGPTPIENRSLAIGGGARYDVAFAMPDGPVRLDVAGTDASLALSPDGSSDGSPAPQRLPDFEPESYGTPAATIFDGARYDRTFVLDITKKFGFRDGRPGRHWAVNGELFPHTPMFMVQEGELVKVRLENHTNSIHPMHLHGHHVLVLRRNGKPTAGSPWWVDTLTMFPDEEYEVAFRADNPGIWMDHCHNLPHARDGLTMHVAYEGVTTPFRIGGRPHNHPE